MDGRESRADDVRAPISVLPGNGPVPVDAKTHGAPGLSRRAVATTAESRSSGSGAVILQLKSGAVVSQREAEHWANRDAWAVKWHSWPLLYQVQLFIVVHASQHQAEQQLVQILMSASTVFR